MAVPAVPCSTEVLVLPLPEPLSAARAWTSTAVLCCCVVLEGVWSSQLWLAGKWVRSRYQTKYLLKTLIAPQSKIKLSAGTKSAENTQLIIQRHCHVSLCFTGCV